MTNEELRLIQSLPLEDKIRKSKLRIREWYDYYGGGVYISFSGGKDSTVLTHLVRSMYPDVPAVFCDTGLEYPEIREFVARHENVTVIRPEMSFHNVLEKYGYPVVSKEQAQYIYEVRTTQSENMRDYRLNGKRMIDGTRGRLGHISDKWKFLIDAPFRISDKCCDIMKKRPFRKYEKKTGLVRITGEMANESRVRKSVYLVNGCNNFSESNPKSMPLGFWTEQDVLLYLQEYKIPYASVYGDIAKRDDGLLAMTGVNRTGCMFCMFGIHFDGPFNRFVRMQQTHPKLHDYCINKLGIGKVLDYLQIPYTSIFNEEAKI